MPKSLADMLDDMNRALPLSKRHHNRGKMLRDRALDCSCHLVVDCDCRDLDGDDAPTRVHANLPSE